MGRNSGINWTDHTWNPVTGCTKVSPACDHCYAERMARRLAGRVGYPAAPHHFDVTLHPERLEEPLKIKRPSRIFVCSMGDLFHEQVPIAFIDQVLEVIAACPQHTFMVLTKRPHLMDYKLYGITADYPIRELGTGDYLPNLWLGVTAENQEQSDLRIPLLLAVPAKKYFVSVEPMLGPVDLTRYLRIEETGRFGHAGFTWRDALDWVIVGGESGPGARPMHPDWVRAVRDQCQTAGVPFWFKQWGEWLPESQIDKFNHDQYPRFGRVNFGTLGVDGYFCEGRYPSDRPKSIDECVYYIGKARAGRILDGREWSERP